MRPTEQTAFITTGSRTIPSFKQIDSYTSHVHLFGWIFSFTLHLLVIIVLFAPLGIVLRLHQLPSTRWKATKLTRLAIRLQAAPIDRVVKERISHEVIKHRDNADFQRQRYYASERKPRHNLVPHFARDTEQNLPRIMANLGVQIGFGDDVIIEKRFGYRFPVWFEVFGPFKYLNDDGFYPLELKESDSWEFIRDIRARGGFEGRKVYALFPKEFGVLVHREIRNAACPQNAVPSVKWVLVPGKYIEVSCIEIH